LVDRVARAHREAYRIIHDAEPSARVSIAQHVSDLEPARARVEDLEALQRWDRFMHTHLLDILKSTGSLDYIGLNYYTRIYVRASRLMPMGVFPCFGETEAALGRRLFRLLGGRRGDRPLTDMGWEEVPEGLGRVALKLWKTYGLPVLVTENGVADASGRRRADFIRSHLSSLADAASQGAQVSGYLHWSLVDNYEWGSFRPRFGLYGVDRDGGFERRPAEGASFYADVCRTNGAALAQPR
ncbi:MAG: glycoside hydrolase family 1 protein, partial [Elusimicrobia bacterium]|nr:glycoside hydrolase family 1 protein [Elusimicrobiota bacterium]